MGGASAGPAAAPRRIHRAQVLDSDGASRFFEHLSDERVLYFRLDAHGEAPTSLGVKRNTLLANCSGEYVACFDDDNYYGPEYPRPRRNLPSSPISPPRNIHVAAAASPRRVSPINLAGTSRR